MAVRIEQDGDDVRVWIKAVPGAARDAIAGPLGDRLKVRVSAPPEGGKANKAICKLLAKRLAVKPAQIQVEIGTTSAEKVVRITDSRTTDIEQRLRDNPKKG